jgi:hypothetical protein
VSTAALSYPSSLNVVAALHLARAATPEPAQSPPSDFSTLLAAHKGGEVEALARERTARNPRDGVAL